MGSIGPMGEVAMICCTFPCVTAQKGWALVLGQQFYTSQLMCRWPNHGLLCSLCSLLRGEERYNTCHYEFNLIRATCLPGASPFNARID